MTEGAHERTVGLVVAAGTDDCDLALDAAEIERIGDGEEWPNATASLHEAIGWKPTTGSPRRVLWVRGPERVVGIRISGRLVMRRVPIDRVLQLPALLDRPDSPIRAVVLDPDRNLLVLAASRIVRGVATPPSSG